MKAMLASPLSTSPGVGVSASRRQEAGGLLSAQAVLRDELTARSSSEPLRSCFVVCGLGANIFGVGPGPAARRMARWLGPITAKRRGVFAAVVLVALLVFGYVRIGWNRMESACTVDRPGHAQTPSIAFDWSWWPPCFTCTFGDGRTETSLWFCMGGQRQERKLRQVLHCWALPSGQQLPVPL